MKLYNVYVHNTRDHYNDVWEIVEVNRVKE